MQMAINMTSKPWVEQGTVKNASITVPGAGVTTDTINLLKTLTRARLSANTQSWFDNVKASIAGGVNSTVNIRLRTIVNVAVTVDTISFDVEYYTAF